MSHFDELPSLKRKKPAPARDAPTPPVPSKPPFEFKSPEDTPEGVQYQATADGFSASAPGRSWLLAGGFVAFAAFLGYLLLTYAGRPDTPTSFVVFIFMAMTALAIFACKFIFGRTKVSLKGDKLRFGNSLFGIWISRSVSLSELERVRVLKLKGIRGFITPGVGTPYNTVAGNLGMSTVSEGVCELETHSEIFKFGRNVQFKHLHYFRYLVITAATERRKARGTANPSLPQA